MLYAIIYKGKVENMINWDKGEWQPGPDRQAIHLPDNTPVSIGWSYNSGEFTDTTPAIPLPDLEVVKTAKYQEIASRCATTITGGFPSDALGTTHTYPSKVTDQANLTASVVDSLLSKDDDNWQTPFWCTGPDMAAQYKLHNKAQIQKVGQDAKAFILATLAKKDTLEAKLTAAKTRDQVYAIGWD
ncbi:tail fiber protein [Pseudomonas phage vB_PpuM-Peetri]